MANNTVTRADLAAALRKKVGLSRSDCRKLLDDTIYEIARSLVERGRVRISNFASFSIRHKKERLGRNPKTGEVAVVSARRVVVFKASKKLKSQLFQ